MFDVQGPRSLSISPRYWIPYLRTPGVYRYGQVSVDFLPTCEAIEAYG